MRRVIATVVTAALSVTLAGCGGGTTSAKNTAGVPAKGGDLVIVKALDSKSMDNTTTFDNDSIWVFEQMMEPLYTVTEDGKGVKPWLATSFTLSPDKLHYTFTLRKGVTFHNGQPMTSADVKFSIDQATKTKGGWEFINTAIKNVAAPTPDTVVVTTKYPWAPLVADLSNFNNGIVPKDYAGMTSKQFYDHPVGTGPFKWDHWTKGSELKLVKNPNYWQSGKPSLDSVTWKPVPDDNTRTLQLQGGQAQINEFPPFSSLGQLKNSSTVQATLFDSTKTDYLLFNHTAKPFNDVHARRAISLAIDREAIIKSVLFGNGKPANSFMPPQVPYYDAATPGLKYDLTAAKAELAKSTTPQGFTATYLAAAGDVQDAAIAQILQGAVKPLGITIKIENVDPATARARQDKQDYQITHSSWTMDIADPDELVSFAVDPTTGAKSFYTGYSNKDVIDATHAAQKAFDPKVRQAKYTFIQKQAAEDAFMAFLYYSPYQWAYSKKVQGFKPYPTGNYHLEDVTLSK